MVFFIKRDLWKREAALDADEIATIRRRWISQGDERYV
jgi:hypothetical protein